MSVLASSMPNSRQSPPSVCLQDYFSELTPAPFHVIKSVAAVFSALQIRSVDFPCSLTETAQPDTAAYRVHIHMEKPKALFLSHEHGKRHSLQYTTPPALHSHCCELHFSS